MKLPFKTEDDLSNRLATASETIRVDYHRRLDQSLAVVLSAHLEKELSKQIESQILIIDAQVKKVNLISATALCVLGVITLAADLEYGRIVSWFLAVAWLAYVGATELFLLPILRIKQVDHWNGFQKYAREWSSLLGNRGFAEHMSLVGTEYRGDVCEEEDHIKLAIRGFALLMAERSAKR